MWDWIVSLDVAKNYESCAYICIGLYKQLEIINVLSPSPGPIRQTKISKVTLQLTMQVDR